MAGNKYWENETPIIHRAAGMELRHYVQAGKLQIYMIDPTKTHGVTRGVTVNLGDQPAEELAKLLVAFDSCFYEAISEEKTQLEWEELVEGVSEVLNG